MRILMRDSLIQATCLQAIEHNIWYNLVCLSRAGRQAGRQTRPSNKQKRQSRCWIRTYIYVPMFFMPKRVLRCTSRTTTPRDLERTVDELHPTKEMKRSSDSDLVLEVGPYPMPHNPMCCIGAAVAHSELRGGDGMAATFASPARHA